MNAVIAIHPYKAKGMWVFDDPEVGLRQESFVSGADAIIDRMFKKFLMPSWALPSCSRHNHFRGSRLTSRSEAQSSAEIGTTALQYKWRAGSVPLSSRRT
jgi:hypothetical protein